MIEQIVSSQASQGVVGAGSVGANTNPLSANASDVMKFNMSMSDAKVDNHSLLDVRAKSDNVFLQLDTKKVEANPIIQMDEAYRSIMVQMKDSPQFNKFMDVMDKPDTAKFRSNISSVEKLPDAKVAATDLLAETRGFYSEARGMAKEISKWQIKTTIWSTNVKFLTSVVSQASSGIKALFHSAG